MSAAAAIGTLLGGIGLFMLGMQLLTDGLKLAAGPALERILAGATRTRWHALAAGVAVTAIAQSSSAVTVATIGFVNAGLLNLTQALWVLFGANVGTTMTGWIVSLVGLQFKIDLLALPLIGIGVGLRLTGPEQRRGAIGTALAGFGLLFLGIDLLRESFTGAASSISLPQGQGLLPGLGQIGVGMLLTVLMQSSSAAMVIAITATQGGLLDLAAGAAVVIGANIGTTATALLASLNATANARRAAAAHIVFNLLTGAIAILIMPALLAGLDWLGDTLDIDAAPGVRLAMFHTMFNVLGVVLIWPFAATLVRALERRFRTAEDDAALPRYLDRTLLAVPTLAIDALFQELRRLGALARAALAAALPGTAADPRAATTHARAAVRLGQAIAAFVVQLNRASMEAASAGRLPRALRIARYCDAVADLVSGALVAASGTARAAGPLPQEVAFHAAVGALLAAADPAAHSDAVRFNAALATVEQAYEPAKSGLLEAGAIGALPVAEMDERLTALSALRRACEQLSKAARMLAMDGEPRAEPPEALP